MTSPLNQFPNANHTAPNENIEENSQPSRGGTKSSNHDPSPSRPRSSQSFPTIRLLVNRVSYFGFAISTCAPLVNFFLTKDNPDMAKTSNLMNWILFGIMWCGVFAVPMGIILFVATSFFRPLDVVPSLGTSLWVVFSIWLTVGVITDTNKKLHGLYGMIHNLPLFSLIMANGLPLLLNLRFDAISGSEDEFPPADIQISIFSPINHMFEDGKHDLRLGADSTHAKSLISIPFLGVSEDFLTAYRDIRENSVKYLRGENLDEFSASFNSWRTKARRIRRVLFLRRLACLFGYVIEAAALYFSFVFLNQLKKSDVHTDKDRKEPASEAIQLLLPIWQIVFVMVLSFFSDYFWAFVDVECTCTSPAEVSSLMLQREESWANWSTLRHVFFDNRNRESTVVWKSTKFGELRAVDLPTIGIIAGDTEPETGTKTLRSAVGDCVFTVKRIAANTIQLQRVREDVEGREAMYSESVEIRETDKVI